MILIPHHRKAGLFSQLNKLLTIMEHRQTANIHVDWSTGTKIMIAFSALVSVMCAVVGIELVRTMWLWTLPSSDAQASSILQMIGGAF